MTKISHLGDKDCVNSIGFDGHPGAKTHNIATALGLAERTLQRLLKKLKGERKIKFRGTTKTGGYFPLEDGE